MKIDIHIGQPKSYSTYYQKQLSDMEKGNRCVYLGFRPQNSISDWYSTQTEQQIIDRALRFDTHKTFRQNIRRYKLFIESKIAESTGKSLPFWMSSENLAMQVLPGEIDVEDKLTRLQSLFPASIELNFHCVFRNIQQAVISLYKQLVNMGYGQSYSYFLDETLLSEPSSYLDGLIPSRLAEQIMEVKGSNCHVNFYYSDNRPCPIIGVETSNSDEVLNGNSQSLHFYQQIAHYNRTQGLGETLSSLIEIHRKYWTIEIDKDDDVWHKRRIIKNNVKTCNEGFTQDTCTNTIPNGELFKLVSLAGKSEGVRLLKHKSWLTQIGSLSRIFEFT